MIRLSVKAVYKGIVLGTVAVFKKNDQQVERKIVADDLSPSETVQMDKEKILAFVTVHGSTNSHTAILARMMNIPALIGVRWIWKKYIWE